MVTTSPEPQHAWDFIDKFLSYSFTSCFLSQQIQLRMKTRKCAQVCFSYICNGISVRMFDNITVWGWPQMGWVLSTRIATINPQQLSLKLMVQILSSLCVCAFLLEKHVTLWGHEFCHVRVDGECLRRTIQGANRTSTNEPTKRMATPRFETTKPCCFQFISQNMEDLPRDASDYGDRYISFRGFL